MVLDLVFFGSRWEMGRSHQVGGARIESLASVAGAGARGYIQERVTR